MINASKMKIYRAELTRICTEHGGVTLQPEHVVEAAREETSPLHDRFCWDDTKAAHQYRLQQARQLITEIYVIESVKREPLQEYVSLSVDRTHGGGYRRVSDVVKDEALRKIMLRDALQAAQLFEQKYRDVQELAKLFKSRPWVEIVHAKIKLPKKSNSASA